MLSKFMALFKKRQPELLMSKNPDYLGYDVGDWTYGRPEIMKWDDKTRLKIGKFCSIARGVRILLGGNHCTHWVTTYPMGLVFEEARCIPNQAISKGDISVGNDVWIGVNSIILSGVTIGDGAVVGAGSVVTRDVAPYAIAAGNPAKTIRKRFDERTIESLLAIKWWDWPMEQIKESLPLLMSDNVDTFITKYKQGQTDKLSLAGWAQ